MEKLRLCKELQNIVDRCALFRDKYSILKAHHTAQEELIKLQKIELENLNLQVKHLVAAFIEHKKCSNMTLQNLKLENQKLQSRRENQERVDNLEGELVELRSKINAESVRYEEQMESMRKSHKEEIDAYKQKLERHIVQESRGNKTSTKRKNVAEINSETENSGVSNNHEINYTHPALDDTTERKKKKKPRPDFRWPQLEIIFNKEDKKKEATNVKKKKLYQLDKEAIVDLAFSKYVE